jgi:DNA-binding response OmpR family regulator
MARILLVDDDEDIAVIVKAALWRLGHHVRHTADGVNGAQIAREWDPALVLLDVGLPGQSGFDTCVQIRRESDNRDLLIVMLTAHGDVPSKLRGFDAGADDYLVKPVDVSELSTRVTRLLDKQGAHTQTIQQRRRDAIREIVATIAHEINNPLTVALGNLDVVVEYEQISPGVSLHLETCRDELLRIAEVVQRLQAVDDRVVPYIGDDQMIDLWHQSSDAQQ